MRTSIAATAFAAGLLVAVSGAARAQDNTAGSGSGPYVGFGLGASFLDDAPFYGPGTNGKADYDTGWGVLGSAGYAFDRNWRAELELGYRRNNVDSMSGGGRSGTGNAGGFSVMGNVLYDIRTGSNWTPYVGVGAGYLRYKASGIAPSATTTVNDTSDVFAYQGIAGVSYNVTPSTQLYLDYHYLRANNPDVTNSAGSNLSSEYRDHLVTVGLRYMFGTAPAAAAAPVQAAAPAPTPAPRQEAQLPRSFQVFFDFDKSNILPDARPIIEEAANNARKGGMSRVTLTGHTDRAGSDAYNQRLSVRRAEAVKAEFVRLGFNPNDVAVVGKGEADPLVPTADGVREPKNRRVEIVF
jgi:OmpA-OmpF porin, OOP family